MAQNKNNKPNSGLYVAVFFVLVILIVIMFFVKKDNIVSNLKKTNFFERVGVATPEFVEKHPVKPEKTMTDDIEIDLMDDSAGQNDSKAGKSEENEKNTSSSASDVKKNENLVQQAENSQNQNEKNAEKSEEVKNSSAMPDGTAGKTEKSENVAKNSVPQKTVSAEKNPAATTATRTTTLYFVSIGADGSVNRQAVKRQLARSDSPLTDAIKALLAGPVPGEKNAMSLIPAGSRLIGASVKDGVATLNFNENFEFNTYGVEGSIGQLMQIVYTATEFNTVKSVQFLIEGEKKEYLGSEGQWIGTPLSRSSF